MQEGYEYALGNEELRKYVDPQYAPFLLTHSIELASTVTERLARALAQAVDLIVPAIQDMTMVSLVFGKPPMYVTSAGVGADIYVADMSLDPVATAGRTHIYLDAERIASLSTYPVDVAVVTLLEELVHVWMNVRHEGIAQLATATLHGGITVVEGRYMTHEQAGMHYLSKLTREDAADESTK